MDLTLAMKGTEKEGIFRKIYNLGMELVLKKIYGKK